MFGFLGDIGGGALDVLKIAGPMVASGLIQKHATKLPNNAIPWVNGALGTVVGTLATGGDFSQGLQLGLVASSSATGLHQVLKIGTRWATGGRVASL